MSTSATASATTSATASTSPSRRRRPTRVSGEEREHAIVAMLQRLLTEHPLHAISVDDLARGAGISRPTFYFYFASKEAVLLTLLERLVAQAREATDEAPELLARDPAGAWRLAIGAALRLWTANRDVIRAAAEVRSSNAEVRELWAAVLELFVAQTATAVEAERDRGVAPPGVPARELALCLNRMNERIFEATLTDGEATLPEERTLDTLVDIWLRAIYGTPPAPAP
jgi:AcrR family transcriptional regulator